jgi:hypothetical protein
MRPEEQDTLSAGLESILSAMHDGIVDHCPKLLPLHRKLTAQIHSERTKYLQERSRLLGLVYRKTDESPNKSRKPSTFNPQAEPQTLEAPLSSKQRTPAAHINRIKPDGREYEVHHEQQRQFELAQQAPNKQISNNRPANRRVIFTPATPANNSYSANSGGLGIDFSYGPKDARIK